MTQTHKFQYAPTAAAQLFCRTYVEYTWSVVAVGMRYSNGGVRLATADRWIQFGAAAVAFHCRALFQVFFHASKCVCCCCLYRNKQHIALSSPLLFFKAPPKKAFQEKTEISVATAPLPV